MILESIVRGEGILGLLLLVREYWAAFMSLDFLLSKQCKELILFSNRDSGEGIAIIPCSVLLPSSFLFDL